MLATLPSALLQAAPFPLPRPSICTSSPSSQWSFKVSIRILQACPTPAEPPQQPRAGTAGSPPSPASLNSHPTSPGVFPARVLLLDPPQSPATLCTLPVLAKSPG